MSERIKNTERLCQATLTPPVRYKYTLLQQGSLPLRPDRRIEIRAEHRCSVLLLWPEIDKPAIAETLLIDPCFTFSGLQQAKQRLKSRSLSFDSPGYIFVTHRHFDHLPNFSQKDRRRRFQIGALPDIELIACPGHARDLLALVFRSTLDECVWVVGDAILDLEWLNAWRYYWPNSYSPEEVVQTWNSVARIISQADLIIPGHGKPIYVTASLVKTLLANFPDAEYADRCPEVAPCLQRRLRLFYTNQR